MRGHEGAGPLDSGAEAERARRRKWHLVLGAALATGLAAGFGFAFADEGQGFFRATIPPTLAAAIAALYLLMMVVGTVAMKRVTDEVEIHNNLYGMAIGGSAVLLVYPPWWILWRGEVLPEPPHEALFLLFFGSALVAYLWKKFR